MIQQTQATLLELVESAVQGIIVCDRQGRIVLVNRLAERLFGYRRETLLNLTVETLIPTAARGLHAEQRAGYFDRPHQRITGLEVTGRRKDGSEFPAEVSLSHLRTEDGEDLAVAFVQDATARKIAENALFESEARSELTVESMTDYAIVQLDRAGTIIAWSAGSEQIFGYSKEEAIGRSFAVFYPEGERQPGLAAEILQHAERAELWQREGWRLRKDGSHFWGEGVIRPVRNSSGEIIGFSDVIRDFTERRLAEEALRNSEAGLARAQQMAHLGSWELDLDTRTYTWSAEMFRILGVAPETFPPSAHAFLDAVHPGDRDAVRESFREASAKGYYASDHRIVRPDGSTRYVRGRGEFVAGAEGQPLRMIGTLQDVTEYKEMEEQLMQSQKMEAIGLLAGGVAHDFNNLLTVINGYSGMLLESLPADSPIRAEIQEIHASGERAAGLTRQLLAFGRKQVLQPRVLDLAELVNKAQPMLRRLIPESVELRMFCAPGSGRVRIDPQQVEQVLLNLVVNAGDAMPSGGQLTIEVSSLDLDASYANKHSEVIPGTYMCLSVSDNGKGMTSATIERIFDPFFTTKAVGHGTGLGLSTVFGIVKQSGGYIWVYSELGAGAVFKTYFPRVDAPAQALPAVPDAAPLPATCATLLVAEDEAFVRKFTVRVLRHLGYEVIEASNGVEALEASREHQGEIHLLVTDVVMPKMSGRELAAKIAPLRPRMQVLFVSGYTEDTVIRNGMLEAGNRLLPKPFSAAALTRMVHEMLQTPRRERAVLLVDDEAAVRGVLRRMLEAAGYRVHEAANGRDACSAFRLTPVDLVVIDLVMPQKEGIETIVDLRRDFPHAQIIAISGAQNGGDLLGAAQHLGAHAILRKPIEAEELLGHVKRLIG